MPSHVVCGCGDVCVLVVGSMEAPPPPAGNLVINWSPGPPQHGYRIKMPRIPPPIKTGICSYHKHCQTFQPNFPSRLFDAVLLFRECLKRNITQWWNVCRQFNFAVQVGHQSPSWPENCGQVHSTGRSARTPPFLFTVIKGTFAIKWNLSVSFKTMLIHMNLKPGLRET